MVAEIKKMTHAPPLHSINGSGDKHWIECPNLRYGTQLVKLKIIIYRYLPVLLAR